MTTVKELIEKLQKMPQDVEVWLEADALCTAHKIEVELYDWGKKEQYKEQYRQEFVLLKPDESF